MSLQSLTLSHYRMAHPTRPTGETFDVSETCNATPISAEDARTNQLNVPGISNDVAELEMGRNGDRKRYKMPMRNITEIGQRRRVWPWQAWLNSMNSSSNIPTKVPHRSFVKQHLDKCEWGEDDIHLLLPEWMHEKLFCKTCCGMRCGSDGLVRYAGDLVLMFFDFCIRPLCGIAFIVATLTTDDSIPAWIHYAGGVFYVLSVPVTWMELVQEVFENQPNPICDIDSNKLKWMLMSTFVLTCVCSPIYGIWSIATLPMDATMDTNFGLKLGGYVFCATTVPWWWKIVVPVGDALAVEDWQIRVLLSLLLLASVIHQAIVGELIWFPYLAVPGILLCIPVMILIPVAILIDGILSLWCFESLYHWLVQVPQIFTDASSYVMFLIAVNSMAAQIADRNLLLPVEELIHDDWLYAGAVSFYLVSIVIIISYHDST